MGRKRKALGFVRDDVNKISKIFVSGDVSRTLSAKRACLSSETDERGQRLKRLFQSADVDKQTSFIQVKQQKVMSPISNGMETRQVDSQREIASSSFQQLEANESDSVRSTSTSTGSERKDKLNRRSHNFTRRHRDPEREKRTVFVGNLPLSTTRRTLKRLFLKYGCIETARLRGAVARNPKIPKRASVIKKDFHPDQGSITGYVVFKEKSAAEEALKSNGDAVEDRHIRVDHANRDKVGDCKKSVFVGNLPYVVDEETLRGLFRRCGDVCAVRVVRDRKTGIGKGFGYVHFMDKAAASLALKFHGSDFNGRSIRVFRATDDRRQEKQSKARKFSGLKSSKKPNTKLKLKFGKRGSGARMPTKHRKGKTGHRLGVQRVPRTA